MALLFEFFDVTYLYILKAHLQRVNRPLYIFFIGVYSALPAMKNLTNHTLGNFCNALCADGNFLMSLAVHFLNNCILWIFSIETINQIEYLIMCLNAFLM